MVSFNSRFIESTPGDPLSDRRPRQVHGALWSKVEPTPVPAPRLVAWSPEVARQLGLDEAALRSPEAVQVLAGNALWPGMEPYAANYGGHQFGNWAGQLGDGRAIIAGRGGGAGRDAPGAAAQGRGAHALLAHAPTAARCCARRSASSCAARRCTTSACRPRGRCRWWRPATRSCATCSTTATPSPSRAPSSAASRRRSCASATSSCARSAGRRGAAAAAGRLHARRTTSRSSARRARRRTRPASTRSARRTARLIAHWMRWASCTA